MIPRVANPSGERLAITLRYYATGDNLKTIAAGYCVGFSTACEIVVDTGIAMYQVLAPEYLKAPDTKTWRNIAIDFSKIWNFPNCVGAIDGKHIAMQASPNAGSDYYNYKHFHSIILMAMCDANYKFTMVDIGAYGREGDKNVYNTSTILKKLKDGSLGLPPSCKLPYWNSILPHCIVGDDAFPLKPFLMKPFSGRTTGLMPREERIFNYRLSRACRVIENAFGILAGRWRIFRKPIIAKTENIKHFTRACIVLHNFLIENDKQYASRGYGDYFKSEGALIEGGWRADEDVGLHPLRSKSGMNFSREAKSVRDAFKNFFTFEGAVPWQNSR